MSGSRSSPLLPAPGLERVRPARVQQGQGEAGRARQGSGLRGRAARSGNRGVPQDHDVRPGRPGAPPRSFRSFGHLIAWKWPPLSILPQGYGLTETCAASFIGNPFKWSHLGTVRR